MFSICSKGVKGENRRRARVAANVKQAAAVDDGEKHLRATSRAAEPARRRAIRASRDDVGRDLVFDEGDAIAQLQLPLLQALQHQQIRRGRLMQRVDRGVEVAVLLLQTRKLGVEFALILIVHGVR
ncbi:hypothetical protein AS156_24335 [Bradyrhizobium macuxiense]|uniref:Uncharacterized protein n=1 Tax=Bradyrhizobium macuxiense TaxID=1755647 RepID=A0A109J8R6_9BRAD|nr:hypothetical protein AS156_24335 [Bradyrhizobium macuxiense]